MKTSTGRQRQQPNAAKPKTAPRPRVVKLEGRIAPRIALNHNETLAREPANARPDTSKPKKASRLKVIKLEGRIAPGIWQNHNETLVREPAEAKPEAPTARTDTDRPKLRVVKLEERIAPRSGGCDEFGCGGNHNETLVRDRA